MAKRDRLVLSPHQSIETSRDLSGRYFICYSSNASVFIRDLKELRRFMKIPKGLPMREALDSWLASLEAIDKERKGTPNQGDIRSSLGDVLPLTTTEPVQGSTPNLSQELLATGFGPEVFQDDEDPTAHTKVII